MAGGFQPCGYHWGRLLAAAQEVSHPCKPETWSPIPSCLTCSPVSRAASEGCRATQAGLQRIFVCTLHRFKGTPDPARCHMLGMPAPVKPQAPRWHEITGHCN